MNRYAAIPWPWAALFLCLALLAQEFLHRFLVRLHGEHRATLPVVRLALHPVRVGLELLLVGDGGCHLLLGLGQLTLHVDDQLVEHLLGVFGPGDQVVEVGPDHRGQAVEDSHRGHPSR